jgi:hypothetical protein
MEAAGALSIIFLILQFDCLDYLCYNNWAKKKEKYSKKFVELPCIS